MWFNLIVVVLLLMTFPLQEFMPMVKIAQNATLFLPPVFFLAGSVAVSFPVMLLMALVTGVLWDARYLPLAAGQHGSANLLDLSNPASGELVDMGIGVSVLLFGVMGAMMQGIRPLFKKGRLELPVLMVGFAMAGWLLIQYLLMTFMRGSFFFPAGVWSKIVTDSLLAMLAAPLIFLMLHVLARVTRYEIKYEGLRYSFNGL